MKLHSPNHRDDLLFVIALLLPAVFAAARYLESERQMDQIAQTQSQSAPLVAERPEQAHMHLAYAQSHGR